MKKTSKGTLIYQKGEVIIKEGENDKSIFFLVSGKVGVYKGKNLVSVINQPNSPIGEISAILGVPRTATCVAMEDSEVVVYKGGIDEIISKFPKTAKAIIKNLAERLAKSTELGTRTEKPDVSENPHTAATVEPAVSRTSNNNLPVLRIFKEIPDDKLPKIMGYLSEKEIALSLCASLPDVREKLGKFLSSRRVEAIKDIMSFYSKSGWSEADIRILEEKIKDIIHAIEKPQK
jgi:CRP-like cAMP-binding protein